MPFAPEDTRVWESSEVMAEFEKVAAKMRLLDGGPAEAFQPVAEKTAGADDSAWEEEADRVLPEKEPPRAEQAFLNRQARLLPALAKIAQDLADSNNIKGAYRVERAMVELKAAMGAPAEGGE